MTDKPWYRSRTLWFNAAGAALLAADAAADVLQPLMGAEARLYVAALLVAGNAFLRAVTTQPLAKGPRP